MDNQIEKIILPNWYQLDVKIKNSNRETFSKTLKLIEHLKSQNLIQRWFYLYEFGCLRLRFESEIQEGILKTKTGEIMSKYGLTSTEDPNFQFGPYWEDKKDQPTTEYLETFANVMSLITQINVQKLQGKAAYPNFRFVDMYSHCIFNNTFHGLNTEPYFLLRRLNNNFDDKDNPELTGIDNLENKIDTSSGINIPLK